MSVQVLCKACRKPIDDVDRFCRHCGQATKPGVAPPVQRSAGSASTPTAAPRKRLRDNPYVVLGLLFFVLGPFALPMLWRSRGFTKGAKIGLTVIVVGIAIFAFWLITKQLYEPLLELDKLNKELTR